MCALVRGGCQDECRSYRECRIGLKFILRATDGISDGQAMSSNALYHMIGRGSVQDYLTDELCLAKQEVESPV